jgi:hypothetical protein
MKKLVETPDWANRTFRRKDGDVIAHKSAIFHDVEGPMFFSGVIGEMLRMGRIPLSLSFYFDMEDMVCLSRMEFERGPDGMNADKRWRSLYSQFEIEDFAKMWNVEPDQVHGVLQSDISLYLSPSDRTWPVQMGEGIVALAYLDGKFILRRDPAYERKAA